ncbi:MAG TPA: hypothetical protein VFE05_21140 [Longimicrobiaceae bacterium]|jgi:hypothetical protein|nr:hypothetical protein [Longimicrobiaceae bacterium]
MHNAVVRRTLAVLAAAPLLALAACDDTGTGGSTPAANYAVVLNSTGRSLTVTSTNDPTAKFTIGLGSQGSPVTLAARGSTVVVPMGSYPFAEVVDLKTRTVTDTVPLPANSGATGVAFLNDSIAVVANSNLNTVTPVNVLRGTTGAQIAVGVFPQAVVAGGNRVYVINAQLVNFTPSGPGTVSVIDASVHNAGTVQLTGFNPSGGVVDSGRLYVVNSGSFGANDGSVSVVDATTLRETSRVAGFGDFPGAIAAGPDHRLYVGVYGTGVIVWDPATGFVRGAGNPVKPGTTPPVSSLGFDRPGRLFVLNPGTCQNPGTVYRLTAAFAVDAQTETGVCPFAIDFASVPQD